MDRISALRNIEEALAAFESGKRDLQSVERQVVTILRTYATEFEEDGKSVYQADEPESVEGLVVVGESRSDAVARISELADTDDVEVTRLNGE